MLRFIASEWICSVVLMLIYIWVQIDNFIEVELIEEPIGLDIIKSVLVTCCLTSVKWSVFFCEIVLCW